MGKQEQVSDVTQEQVDKELDKIKDHFNRAICDLRQVLDAEITGCLDRINKYRNSDYTFLLQK